MLLTKHKSTLKTPSVSARLATLFQPCSELLDFFLEYHKDEKWGFVGAPLHDPCTIAWLLKPELFTSVERWVGVETQGKYSEVMTVLIIII